MKIRSLHIPLRIWTWLLVTLTVTSCGGTLPARISTPASQTATITYAFPDDPASTDEATKLIEAYQAANPTIQIKPQPLPASEYAQQLLTQVHNNALDLFVSTDTQIPALLNNKALLNLQPLLPKTSKVLPTDFQAPALIPWQRSGALYGFPTDVVPLVLFYNQDLFDANQIPYPASNWTWEAWKAAATKLTVSAGGHVTRYGTALSEWSAMIWGNGGELLNADNTRTLIDSAEAAAGVQFAADMVNVQKVAPLPQAAGGPDPVELFKQQKVAMLPASSSVASSFLQAKLPFRWAIAPFPAGVRSAARLSVSGLAISANSKQPSSALDFATWAVGPDGQAIRAAIQPFAAPALRASGQRPTQVAGAEAIAQALQTGRTLPQVEQWPKIASIVNESLVPVWQGKQTAADAYHQVVPKIDALLGG